MSYDSTLKTQVARWGKRSKKNAIDLPIMDEKQFGRDPFKDSRNEKKLRVSKNKLNESNNRKAHAKERAKSKAKK